MSKPNTPAYWMGDPKRGAALGRAREGDKASDAPMKFNLMRVRLDRGGYDPGGAYWGLPSDLYFACCGETEFYLRAKSRDAAKAEVCKDFPNARFYR